MLFFPFSADALKRRRAAKWEVVRGVDAEREAIEEGFQLRWDRQAGGWWTASAQSGVGQRVLDVASITAHMRTLRSFSVIVGHCSPLKTQVDVEVIYAPDVLRKKC